MTDTDQNVLSGLLDGWQRGNAILLNLLGALTPEELDASALPGSPNIAELFAHMHSVRLFWLRQTAPEFVEGLTRLTAGEGDSKVAERDPERIEAALKASAQAVAEAVRGHVESGEPLQGPHARYDHPALLLMHLLWHEGYHVGQLKLALKQAGRVLSDPEEERLIWSLWRTEEWPES